MNICFQASQATRQLEYELNNDQFNKLFQLWFGSLKTGRTFEDPYDGFEAFGDADDVLTKVYFRNFEAVEVLYEHEDEDLSFKPTLEYNPVFHQNHLNFNLSYRF